MTDRPSRSLEEEIRTAAEQLEREAAIADRESPEPDEFCKAAGGDWFRALSCLLRAALDRIEGLTQNLNGLDADYGNLLREHEDVSRELSHLRAENARQAQEIQRLREALLRACEDSASGDHAQAGGPEWPSERFREGRAGEER